MVFVSVGSSGGFCVDRIEVTNAHYQAFLDDLARSPSTPVTAACGADDSHVPRSYPPPAGAEALPVTFVDYCDAEAYCAWSGKELCGDVRGAALDDADLHDAERDAWFIACGGPGRTFPYGDAYEPSACNGVDQGLLGPRSADAGGACLAPSGALELSGNVWEWTRACEGDLSLSQRCHARGGAFNAPASELTCTSERFLPRSSADATTGFRCCAPIAEGSARDR